MMGYAAAFGAGLIVGLLLNWRSWKALDAYITIARLEKEAHDLVKATNDKLWGLLDADKRRH